MATITQDAIKKLDKRTVNLIECKDISSPDIEKLRELIIKDHPEFKCNLLFISGEFDIKYLKWEDLSIIEDFIKKLRDRSTARGDY